MRMTGLPDGSVAFESATLREEPRTRIAIPPMGASDEDALVVMCAWCRSVDLGAAQWVD